MYIHRVDLENELAGVEGKHAGIKLDFDMEWDGDCDIALRAALKPVGVSFGVQNFKLCGRMYLILSPLTSELPVVSAAQFGFINPPRLDLSFTGAASALSSLKVIEKKIPALIQSVLNGVLVLPQRMGVPIDPAYNPLDTYQPPVGMLRVTILGGRGLRVQRAGLVKDIPDPYCKISLGASDPVRTSTKKDTLSPSWDDEPCDFILYDLDQKVYLKVYDEDNALDFDDLLGVAEITARDLFKSGGKAEVELEKNGMNHGIFITLAAELFHLSARLGSLSAPEYSEKNQLCGLVTIGVTQAFDVSLPKEDAATFVKCVYGEGSKHERTFTTPVVVDAPGIDALNPMYDSVFHVPLTAAMMRQEADGGVAFTLVDGPGASNGSDAHGELGKIVISHERLRRVRKHTVIETKPIGEWGARLDYAVCLNGMQTGQEASRGEEAVADDAFPSEASSHGASAARGDAMIRVTAVKGRGFRVKKRLGRDSVPDVYCKVRVRSVRGDGPPTSWRTATIKNDTMPQWHESTVFGNVDPAGAVLCVDAYQDSKVKDHHLGCAEFPVGTLLRKRIMEMELKDEATPTETYVTFKCVELGAGKHTAGKDGTSEAEHVSHNVNEGEEASSPALGESWIHAVADSDAASAAPPGGRGLPPTPVEERSATPEREGHADGSGGTGDASPSTGPRSILITAVRGRGFPVKKHRIGKDDVPDVYCKVRLSREGKPADKWKTSVVKNSTTPEWHETREYGGVDPSEAMLRVDAYNSNKLDDDYLGHVELPVGSLLEKRTWEMELTGKKGLTGSYVTFQCDPA